MHPGTRLQVSTRVVPIVRPTPHALVPAALPSTIGNLKALEILNVQRNSLLYSEDFLLHVNESLSMTSCEHPELVKPMQERLGCLMYAATSTRPDIAYAVHQLCKCMHKPTPELLEEADHVLSYLARNASVGLTYAREPTRLAGFAAAEAAAGGEAAEKAAAWADATRAALRSGSPSAAVVALHALRLGGRISEDFGPAPAAEVAAAVEITANSRLAAADDFAEGVACAIGARRGEEPRWAHRDWAEAARDPAVATIPAARGPEPPAAAAAVAVAVEASQPADAYAECEAAPHERLACEYIGDDVCWCWCTAAVAAAAAGRARARRALLLGARTAGRARRATAARAAARSPHALVGRRQRAGARSR